MRAIVEKEKGKEKAAAKAKAVERIPAVVKALGNLVRVRILKVKDLAKVSEDTLEEKELEDLEEDAMIVEART